MQVSRKTVLRKTQAEALKRRDEYILQDHMGINQEKEKTLFLDYAHCWLNVYRTECGTALQKQYHHMVDTAAEILAKPRLKDIRPADIQHLCNAISDRSVSYVTKMMNIIREIFKAAVADGIIIHSPADSIRKIKAQKCEGHRSLESWEHNLILDTYKGHEFGPAAMAMMYAGLRRGELLYLDIDRDVDFVRKTLTVRGAVSFAEGNQGAVSGGKTANARRTIPLVKPLELALQDKHGLLCTKEDGSMMSQAAFSRKYESYIVYLETCLNGCCKRWYGKTKAHKKMIEAGEPLPPWREINIRCHDFWVDYCTRNYLAGIPMKTLQNWMGHSDTTMILRHYTKLTEERERQDAASLTEFMNRDLEEQQERVKNRGEKSLYVH